MDASASLGLPIDAKASTLFNNPLLVSVHVTDALWASVNDAYVKASCIGQSAASVQLPRVRMGVLALGGFLQRCESALNKATAFLKGNKYVG
jgi:hypothetical protein